MNVLELLAFWLEPHSQTANGLVNPVNPKETYCDRMGLLLEGIVPLCPYCIASRESKRIRDIIQINKVTPVQGNIN